MLADIKKSLGISELGGVRGDRLLGMTQRKETKPSAWKESWDKNACPSTPKEKNKIDSRELAVTTRLEKMEKISSQGAGGGEEVGWLGINRDGWFSGRKI